VWVFSCSWEKKKTEERAKNCPNKIVAELKKNRRQKSVSVFFGRKSAHLQLVFSFFFFGQKNFRPSPKTQKEKKSKKNLLVEHSKEPKKIFFSFRFLTLPEHILYFASRLFFYCLTA